MPLDDVEVISISSSIDNNSSSSEVVEDLTPTITLKDTTKRKDDFMASWDMLFPEITDTYLHYALITQNRRIFPPVHQVRRPCSCPSPEYRKRNVRCYHFYGRYSRRPYLVFLDADVLILSLRVR